MVYIPRSALGWVGISAVSEEPDTPLVSSIAYTSAYWRAVVHCANQRQKADRPTRVGEIDDVMAWTMHNGDRKRIFGAAHFCTKPTHPEDWFGYPAVVGGACAVIRSDIQVP